MNTNQIVNNLKEAVKQDKRLEEVLVMFGARERARNQVTVRALVQRMNNEGWKNFTAEDAKSVINTLAKVGVGKLEKNGNRVSALTEIHVTLQSLGQAVCGHMKHSLELFQQRNTYAPVTAVKKPAPETLPAHPMRRATDRAPMAADTLTMSHNGKPVVVQFPEGFTAQEIADFLVSVRSWKGREGADKNS